MPQLEQAAESKDTESCLLSIKTAYFNKYGYWRDGCLLPFTLHDYEEHRDSTCVSKNRIVRRFGKWRVACESLGIPTDREFLRRAAGTHLEALESVAMWHFSTGETLRDEYDRWTRKFSSVEITFPDVSALEGMVSWNAIIGEAKERAHRKTNARCRCLDDKVVRTTHGKLVRAELNGKGDLSRDEVDKAHFEVLSDKNKAKVEKALTEIVRIYEDPSIKKTKTSYLVTVSDYDEHRDDEAPSSRNVISLVGWGRANRMARWRVSVPDDGESVQKLDPSVDQWHRRLIGAWHKQTGDKNMSSYNRWAARGQGRLPTGEQIRSAHRTWAAFVGEVIDALEEKVNAA